MPTAPARPETIAALLATCDPMTRALATAARKGIVAAVPMATERLRAGWGLIGYNAPAYFAFLAVDGGCARIGFEWGSLLADPHGLLEGEGKQVRYVTLRVAKDLTAPALIDLLRQAAVLTPPKRR